MGGLASRAETKLKAPLSPLLFSVAPLHRQGSTETLAGVLDQFSVQIWLVKMPPGGIFSPRPAGQDFARPGEGGEGNQNQDRPRPEKYVEWNVLLGRQLAYKTMQRDWQ